MEGASMHIKIIGARMLRSRVVFLAAALACIFQVSFGQQSLTSQMLSADQQLARDIFRELIEINTSTSVGSTKAA